MLHKMLWLLRSVLFFAQKCYIKNHKGHRLFEILRTIGQKFFKALSSTVRTHPSQGWNQSSILCRVTATENKPPTGLFSCAVKTEAYFASTR